MRTGFKQVSQVVQVFSICAKLSQLYFIQRKNKKKKIHGRIGVNRKWSGKIDVVKKFFQLKTYC